MTEFKTHAPGTPCWVDLMTPDVDASVAFYSSVFDWDAEDQFDNEGNRVYVLFSLEGRTVAGVGGQPPGLGEMPAVWNTYIATDDVAATAEKVTTSGGTVMMPPMQVMDSGEMAVFVDPAGATFSVWKAGTHPGIEVGNVPNTLSWNELSSRDVNAALPFYQAVFGWKFADGGMPGYHLIAGGTNDEGLGAIMAMPAEVPDEVPSYWAVYFTVADLEATRATVTANGGSELMPPMEIPGIGTMGMFYDPTGGSFCTMQPAA